LLAGARKLTETLPHGFISGRAISRVLNQYIAVQFVIAALGGVMPGVFLSSEFGALLVE